MSRASTEHRPRAAATPRRGVTRRKPAPAARFTLGTVGQTRQRNPVWLAGGLLLIALCSLGGVLLFSSADDRTKVVIAAVELQPGKPLSRDDLRVTDMVLGDGVAAVSPTEASALVGLLPVGRVPAGTLLSASMFSAAVPLAGGEMVFGAALDPGEAPQSHLDIGAAVELLFAPKAGTAGTAAVAQASSLGRGVVWAAESLATGQLWVSLRVPVEVGRAASQAAQDDALRIVLVGTAP